MASQKSREPDEWRITWRDAVERDRFVIDSQEPAPLAVNVSRGWIRHEDDERVELVTFESDTGEGTVLSIPTGWVLKRERARFVRPKKTKKADLVLPKDKTREMTATEKAAV